MSTPHPRDTILRAAGALRGAATVLQGLGYAAAATLLLDNAAALHTLLQAHGDTAPPPDDAHLPDLADLRQLDLATRPGALR